MKYIC